MTIYLVKILPLINLFVPETHTLGRRHNIISIVKSGTNLYPNLHMVRVINYLNTVDV